MDDVQTWAQFVKMFVVARGSALQHKSTSEPLPWTIMFCSCRFGFMLIIEQMCQTFMPMDTERLPIGSTLFPNRDIWEGALGGLHNLALYDV